MSMPICGYHHPDLIHDSVAEVDDEFIVHAELTKQAAAACRPADGHKHETRVCTYADLPIYSDRAGRYLPTTVHVRLTRYKDPATGKTSTPRPDSLPRNHKVTSRLFASIRSGKGTHIGLSHSLGLPEATLRSIRMSHFTAMEANYKVKADVHIALDDCHLGGPATGVLHHSRKRGIAVITAQEGNRILEVGPNTKKETVAEMLKNLAALDVVCYVTIDMARHFRAAIYSVLPHVKIIIDRWHVIRLVIDVVQDARKDLIKSSKHRKALKAQHWLIAKSAHKLDDSERAALREWLEDHPLLRELHRLMQDFRHIYERCTNSSEAIDAYDAWKRSFPTSDGDPSSQASQLAKSVEKAFARFNRTVDEWMVEIFNWFDAPTKNGKRPSQGHAENRNRHIKARYAASQGMKFETLRHQMIWGSNPLEYLVSRDLL